MGKYIKKLKIYLAETHPHIAAEWHPTKNGKLIPFDVIGGTDKKIWWQCNKGHEWITRVVDRTCVGGTNCPYCSNRKVCKDNCLEITHPHIAAEWHPTKNGKLTPFDVTSGSSKKIWWQCNKVHEWKAVTYCRTNGSNCPYCSNRKVCKDNCLETTHPHIAAEWHPTKNGKLMPIDVTYGIAKKIWWQCNKVHEWIVSVNSRTNNNAKCPYCVGRLASKENCLASLSKKLTDEWHPTKNGKLTPFDVTLYNGKKIWWQCSNGHEWQSTVDKRSNKRNCPYCSNRKINETNSFEVKNPEISKEWHPTKNGNLRLSQVAPNCGKKAWWICKEKHEWLTRICDRNKNSGRTNRGSGCPKCKAHKSQKKLFEVVEALFPNEKIEFNYKNNTLRFPDTNYLLELDIYIPNRKIAIEYQGKQHYKPIKYWGGVKKFLYVQDRDYLKKIVCEQNNIKLFEVKYTWKRDKKTIYKLLEEYV